MPSTIARLKAIRHVMLDMDGTIYLGGRLFDSTKPFLQILRTLDIGYSFLTNNSALSVEDYVERLNRMGLSISREQLYTSTLFTADFLKERYPGLKRLYVVGTRSMKMELQSLGFEIVSTKPDAVIIGSDIELSYQKLGGAAFWLKQGIPFIATHPDRLCPTDIADFLAIDCGWFTDFLRQITGASPLVLGKPNPDMLRHALRSSGLRPEQVAMCGDRYETDIKMAIEAGAFSVQICDSDGGAKDVSKPADMCIPDLMTFGGKLYEIASRGHVPVLELQAALRTQALLT